MAKRIIVFLFIVLIVGVSCYLYYLNPENAVVKFGQDKTLEYPLAILLICTFFLGAATTGSLAVFAGIKRGIEDWSRARSNKSKEEETHLLEEGRNQLLLSQHKQAIKTLEKVVSKNPTNSIAWLSLANAAEASSGLDEAISVLDRARTANPDNLEILIQAALSNERKGNLTASYDNLKIATKVAPGNAEVLKLLLDRTTALGHHQEAVELIGKISRTAKSEENKILQEKKAELELTIACQKEDEEAKIRSIEYIISKHKRFAPALQKRAEIYAAKGNLPKASSLLNKAFKESGDVQYLRKMFEMWTEAKQPQEAISNLRAAVKSLKSPHSQAELFVLYANLKLGMLADAKTLAEKISSKSKLDSNEEKLLNFFKARIQAREGKLSESTQALTDIVALEGLLNPFGPLPEVKLPRIEFKNNVDAPAPHLSTP